MSVSSDVTPTLSQARSNEKRSQMLPAKYHSTAPLPSISASVQGEPAGNSKRKTPCTWMLCRNKRNRRRTRRKQLIVALRGSCDQLRGELDLAHRSDQSLKGLFSLC